jgi:hypothetical protein
MVDTAPRLRSDPYANETTLVRRRRGLAGGAYLALTIVALGTLVVILLTEDIFASQAMQNRVAIVTLVIAFAFVFAISRRRSRAVETPLARLLITSWIAAVILSWGGTAIVLLLPIDLMSAWGPRVASRLAVAGLVIITIGVIGFTASFSRDWRSRRRRDSQPVRR